MSLHEYKVSRELYALDPTPPFYGLIMAAMRQADSSKAHILRRSFPEVWDEFHKRWNSPDGKLPEERATCSYPRCFKGWITETPGMQALSPNARPDLEPRSWQCPVCNKDGKA